MQDDCLTANPSPPLELIDFYGVRAQMLGPIPRNDLLIGWISVHYILGPRKWSEVDITKLGRAIARVQQELGKAD